MGNTEIAEKTGIKYVTVWAAAKKIREQNSTANEVAKARAMIDELDKKPAAAKKGTAGKNQKKKKAAPKKNKK